MGLHVLIDFILLLFLTLTCQISRVRIAGTVWAVPLEFTFFSRFPPFPPFFASRSIDCSLIIYIFSFPFSLSLIDYSGDCFSPPSSDLGVNLFLTGPFLGSITIFPLGTDLLLSQISPPPHSIVKPSLVRAGLHQTPFTLFCLHPAP